MTAAWAGAFRDLPRERGFEPLRVEGTIPGELRGTLVRCGPALMSSFGRSYRHLFDGDGAVTAVRLDNRGAHGAVRIVDTPGLVAERHAGRALYPAYGTLPPGPAQPLPRPKHAANISMLSLGELLRVMPAGGLAWLFLGGAAYTLGSIVYITKKMDFFPGVFGFHEVWHIFVILGCLFHYLAILLYVAPVPAGA